MRKDSVTSSAAALILAIWATGCTAGTGRVGQGINLQLGQRPDSTRHADSLVAATLQPSAEQDAGVSMVSPAVAYEAADSSAPIRQVSGTLAAEGSIVQSISSTVTGGMRKISDALMPATSVMPADDPTSLSTPAKPSANLYMAMARLAEQSRKFGDAERHYRQALQLSPKHLGALMAYARLKARLGRLEQAAELYEKASRAHPSDPSVFNDLGLCLARQGKLPEAVAALKRAIELRPREPLYRNNIAATMVEMGDADAAFAQQTVVHDEANAHYNVAYLLQKKGDSRAAAIRFARALEKNPKLVQARIWLDKLNGKPTSTPAPSPRLAERRLGQPAPKPPAGQAAQRPQARPFPLMPKGLNQPPRPAVPGRTAATVSREEAPLPSAQPKTRFGFRSPARPPTASAGAPPAPLPKTTSVRRLPAAVGATPRLGIK